MLKYCLKVFHYKNLFFVRKIYRRTLELQEWADKRILSLAIPSGLIYDGSRRLYIGWDGGPGSCEREDD